MHEISLFLGGGQGEHGYNYEIVTVWKNKGFNLLYMKIHVHSYNYRNFPCLYKPNSLSEDLNPYEPRVGNLSGCCAVGDSLHLCLPAQGKQ